MMYPQSTETFGLALVKEVLKNIVNSCYESALEKQKIDSYIVLEPASGLATIPLSGIDVPFHSRYLWSGVMSFRACE
jgi:fatty acid synthase subunit alpha, fungi type